MVSGVSLGVIFHPKFPLNKLIETARRVETAGFDELWLWEDCFYGGAFSGTASVLASTERLRVGIGILPATVRNPLFTAMEIATLANLYPGRIIPGFGHGVGSWMKQIGAAPKSSLAALEETVTAIRALLRGETVTLIGEHVHLEVVKLEVPPEVVPPLYVGAIREKSLHLAGRAGDGTILTGMSSPAYVSWACGEVGKGMAAAGRAENHKVVYVHSKVSPQGETARQVSRRVIAECIEGSLAHLAPLGIAEEALALVREYGIDGAAERMPESWVDDLSAAGTPEQAAAAIYCLRDAGADSIVLQAIDGDLASLDEYIQYLLPAVK